MPGIKLIKLINREGYIKKKAKKYRPVIKRVFSHYFETLFLILGTCIYTCNVTQLYLESWTANEQLEAVHTAGVEKSGLRYSWERAKSNKEKESNALT